MTQLIGLEQDELHDNRSTNSNSNDSIFNLFHMEQEKLDEYGYPIHLEYNFAKPQSDFETRIALAIAFGLIIIGILYGKF